MFLLIAFLYKGYMAVCSLGMGLYALSHTHELRFFSSERCPYFLFL